MTTTAQLQTTPYLREQRQFPNDNVKELANQMDHAYIDIASKVNLRTIGIYAVNFPVISGNSWYLKGSAQRQQTLRRVYTFTGLAPIPHGIDFNAITQFTQGYGTYTDGTNDFGVLFGTSVAIAGQVTFFITPTNIVLLSGAGAPAIVSGSLVVEWLSEF